jgi:hypothetical protein
MHAFRIAPPAERPSSPPPSYGVPTVGGTLVPWDHVIDRLKVAAAYWLATTGTDGRPHVVPVWGVFADDDVYLEVGASSTAKVRHLHRDPGVVVHLDDADDVVIVHGAAHFIVPTGDLATLLVEAFRAKYPGYVPEPDAWDDGSLVRIDPRTILAWRDMPTATRWRFPR